jgi:hypothetical protein
MGSLTQSSSVGAVAAWSGLSREQVISELDRVLQSPQFHASRKCTRFLNHIVQAALDRRFDSLKERTLGVDVFERAPHYDTNQDPIVRGTAGEVRKRLAQYYLQAHDECSLRFSLPAGSYIPEVQKLAPAIPHLQPVPVAPARVARPRRQAIRGRWLAGVLGLSLLAAGTLWAVLRPRPLDRFWSPILASRDVLVCMGQPQVYAFSPKTGGALNPIFSADFEERQHMNQGLSIPVSDIIPVGGEAVALADTQAFTRLSTRLSRRQTHIDLRGERSVSLSDLRAKPAVFIGAFDNHWTLKLAQEFRFYFNTEKEGKVQVIRDRWHPKADGWQLIDAWPPGKDIDHDYALVARVLNKTTEQPMIILAGITQFGTDAAAEFVTDPTYFDQALKMAPRDWSGKNMQFVLSTKVFSGVSGPPRVVAAYFW